MFISKNLKSLNNLQNVELVHMNISTSGPNFSILTKNPLFYLSSDFLIGCIYLKDVQCENFTCSCILQVCDYWLNHYLRLELFKLKPQSVFQARLFLDRIVADINTNKKDMVRKAIHHQYMVSSISSVMEFLQWWVNSRQIC